MADCPLALAHSDGPENDRQRERRSSRRRTKIPENEWDGATSITRISMTSCFTQILLSRHMGCCCGAEMRPRWWAGLAWPNLATQGRQAAHLPSAETVSMVPGRHMDNDWSGTETLSACIRKSILWFKSSCLNCKLNRKADLRCGVVL